VIDLAGGRALHASGGRRRERYRAVEAVAGEPIPPGDARALARAYVDRLGLTHLYVADLDAIAGRPPQDAVVAAVVATAPAVWVDGGVSSVEAARRLTKLGAARVIVGLETLSSLESLAAVCRVAGGDRVAFSLDLRNGRPLRSPALEGCAADLAPTLAKRAADAGVGSVIVIDLARVGGRSGPDVELIARVREAVPNVTLLAGGGIRADGDLARLARVGCDGALLATALHDGTLDAAAIAAAAQLAGRFRS
jgi:phosphoribosylformimino-5-aminoimidazole carboxamide ribotide isomerase